MMKSLIGLPFLVLSACGTGEQDGTDATPSIAARDPLNDLDAVPTGSTCDTASPDPVEGFAPAAGQIGSTAIAKDSRSIAGWATRVVDVDFGESVDEKWKNVELALGPAEGSSTSVVSLGEGGSITLGFATPLVNQAGFDFCVFENSFSDDFLELALVEVASNAGVFVRFAAFSQVPTAVDAYGTIEPMRVDGMAGKYRQGYCTPFDLSELARRPEVATGALDLANIRYVRLRDVVGDGRDVDCMSNTIYDPYPTTGGAGFDLDAIAVLSPAN